jgi:tetratricopeptide (TPR) repeat protein
MAYGEALSESGQIAKAEAHYQDLMVAYPAKSEISAALKNLSARKTLNEGGYEALAGGTGSYRDILKNKDEAVQLEQQHRVVKSADIADRLIRENISRLEKEPRNLKLVRDIAELHAQKKEYDKALEFYERIRTSDAGNDPSLEKAIAETTLKRFDHVLAGLNLADPAQAARAEEIKAERTAFQLEECRQRAERYPTDLLIKFDLGQLYYQAGKYNEAISEFQKAQANPQKRLQAMAALGQCMAAKGMYDLASRRLQDALREKTVFDDEKKELLYLYGTVLEKMNNREEAIKQFIQIYEMDIGYKDVSAKVDAHYASQG